MNTEQLVEFIDKHKNSDMEVLINRGNNNIFVWVKNLACVEVEQYLGNKFRIWLHPEQTNVCTISTFKEAIECYQQAADLADLIGQFIADDQRLG